uniref:FHA domain-containing protein n=1 Tax=Pseudo-nitzschia delicatissima TaxID=44447 RepID=A0A7S0XLF8_9STRA|mmetsp:Transcript_153/g.340  ORF Transcript_153/g.340 Transcript_153/m.340 type:complete len:284 (+) Transcript_153:1742-2593(+)
MSVEGVRKAKQTTGENSDKKVGRTTLLAISSASSDKHEKMMTDFQYTLDDEPTEDWSVEEVLRWWHLRANAESDAEYNAIVEALGKQLEEGKKAIWEAHDQVSKIVQDSENLVNQNVKPQMNSKQQSIEKPDPKPKAVAVTAAATRSTRAKKVTTVAPVTSEDTSATDSKPDTIHIDVVDGPYKGQFYDLQPKTRSPCWIGRSSSAKFKDRGISLPVDLEVSTTHGKFEFKHGKFYYTDAGSTNGTRINGEDCESNKPYELETKGMTILAGQTTMNVTLLKLV